MLELQRASAGSGKTFTLAKKFIWYYITILDGKGRRRLRTPAELQDSLGHILAVTFTNKATNEMQQRIVEKLYLLAFAPQSGKRPDYMDDFRTDLSAMAGREVKEEEISEACRHAVSLLLNNYSDFHVSTIDSFFQQVLRTFAYESDLSDSYRIEIDTDHLSAMAIDGLLEDINSGRDRSDAGFWIDELMGRAKTEGKKWNIFAKSAGDNPYTLLTESVKRLENEEFKEIRQQLDEYFASGVDLKAIYLEMKENFDVPLQNAYGKLIKAVREMRRALDRYKDRLHPTEVTTTFGKRMKKMSDARPYQLPKNTKKERILDFTPSYAKAYHDRKKKGDTMAYEAMEEVDIRLGEAYNEWAAILSNPAFMHWQVYRENFPFMGMLQAIRDKRDEYLRENNAIELGETNAMLHDIIGEDDAPFIYERIGTRLNHFLIDEFQDTSKMQWRNMSPLLHESIARGNENLIIGDAKQSIYRFRNADSSLISRRVPEEFGCAGGEASSASAQNTNWRSQLHIVQFNNSFFDFLTTRLNDLTGVRASSERCDFERDYRNVVQNPKKRDDRGYVEVVTRTDSDSSWKDHVLNSIPRIVEDALSRGYEMHDIAVLVDRNVEGEAVIAALTEYNAQPGDEKHYLEYVSEQSLKLSGSPAVALVVSVLETICRGADPEVRSGEERARKGVADWSQVACNFKFYALKYPELSTPDCLARFFAEGSDNDAISSMLRKMQAVTLPALVESIIAEFITDGDLRQREAVFLAAFQDLVLEYCESHPSDIASFLKWWTDQSPRASISSPEDMDAITVMTVHKSKGLEFPIVIVPFADASFKDSSDKKEWRWEEPAKLTSEAGPLPPYIPVATTETVKGTVHEHVLNEYYDLKKMDALNSIYVAFTRASDELYIFSRPGAKTTEDKTAMSSLFSAFFSERAGKAEGIEHMRPELVFQEEEGIWSYGTKPTMKYLNDSKSLKQAESSGEKGHEILADYAAHSTPKVLVYKAEDAPEVTDADDPELSDDPDPRSEGNRLHEIMQGVEKESDIPRAVRRMAIKGEITASEASRLGAFLTAKVARPEVNDWFTGDWRVINERPIIRDGKQVRRPDRVMISPAGDAVVVDYKFGESESTHKRYCRQVYDYVEMLKNTGKFRSVTGYLWYVRLDRVELVSK